MTGIFLDRDGVIIRKAPEGKYITKLEEMELLPGAAEAIAELTRSGFKVIVVTNQRGVSTGRIKLPDLDQIHVRLKQVIASHGGRLCDIFYCPHDISEGCQCRKPKAGMLRAAAVKYRLSLTKCWMVGDAASDISAGKSAGCKTALITSSGDSLAWVDPPDFWAESLSLATRRILTTDF